jgi:anion-transporting  ArsA/GET3 family ATPase
MNPIAQALSARRVLVCVGAGGVGKTTVGASLALLSAAGGKSSLVCTIDPARRLANSLGLKELGNQEATIPPAELARAQVPAKAPMSAMMLDMKQSWDELIERAAPKDVKARILQNRYYQTLSTKLAGSQEYIALQKLWELSHQRDYGMIVLDTPPTAHALDFLDAPSRILDFLDNDAARWLLTPALAAGKFGLHLFNLGGSFAAKTIAKFTGAQMLSELADFMFSVRGLYDGFRDRAKGVRQMLESDQTSFVLVTTPMKERLGETVHFHQVLRQNGMHVAAIVANRVHTAPPPEAKEQIARAPADLRERLATTLAEAELLAKDDQEALAALARDCDQTPIVRVPRFELDVHDLAGLWKLGQLLIEG